MHKFTRRIIVTAAAVVVGGFALAGCGSSAPAQPRDTITSDGTYTVGVDVLPGTYAARVPEKGTNPLDCVWQLRSSSDTKLSDQSNLGGGMPDRVVELAAGQTFTTAHCGLWLPPTV